MNEYNTPFGKAKLKYSHNCLPAYFIKKEIPADLAFYRGLNGMKDTVMFLEPRSDKSSTSPIPVNAQKTFLFKDTIDFSNVKFYQVELDSTGKPLAASLPHDFDEDGYLTTPPTLVESISSKAHAALTAGNKIVGYVGLQELGEDASIESLHANGWVLDWPALTAEPEAATESSRG